MFPATITNEEINQMPVGHFPGRILVVDSEESMREAEQILASATLLGYDTESRPSFQKGIKHGLALIQITTGDTAFLFRVQLIPLSETIHTILSSPEVLKIGAALRDDLRAMRHVAKFTPAGFLDLQSIVGQWEIKELSVKKLAGVVLGMKISKAQRLTNWEAVQLTESQQDYAAMDAWACREVYLRLRADNPERMTSMENLFVRQQLPTTAVRIVGAPGAEELEVVERAPRPRRRHRAGKRHRKARPAAPVAVPIPIE